MRRFKPSRGFEAQEAVEAPYKKGDFIGTEYEVYGVLGGGGFGVVYLVYHHAQKAVLALKTFHEEYLKGADARELFRREAQTWVDLERHAYLVHAYYVDEVSDRLYIAMEYIAPDEQERNTLQHYLDDKQSFDLAQSLRWAIQFCYGMEYAYSRGIKCHRDIKPDNILISDNTVKLSDFGLAVVAGAIAKGWCGTVGYIAPEVEQGKEASERSDIYSFGIVLWQMAARSANPPSRGWLGRIPSVDGPMQAIIQQCLNNNPDKRCLSFNELRGDLETLLKRETGEVIEPPKIDELEAWELVNKGKSLSHLGRPDEAIPVYNEALELNPRYADAYNNRGTAYGDKGEYDRAIADYNEALKINPRDAEAYNNRGTVYGKKGEYDRAIADYNEALKINPRDAEAYTNRAVTYYLKKEYDKAWEDVHKVQGLGLQVPPDFLDALREASGRQK